jgi:5-methylcytosine-specific restriction endonuclease McrA
VIPKLERPIDLLRDIAAGELGPAIQARAQALVEREDGHRRRVLGKSLARRKGEALEEESETAEHRALVEKIRQRDKVCQLCDDHGPPLKWDPLDPHHLELGNGKAERERLENMLLAHRSCHDAYHMNPRRFVLRVKAWCARNRYPLPNRKEFR